MNGTTPRSESGAGFDALTAARELKAAGFEPTQAEALAAQLRTAAGADHDALATKSSITALKSDIAALRVEIRIIGAIVLAIAAKLFGIFNAVASVLS